MNRTLWPPEHIPTCLRGDAQHPFQLDDAGIADRVEVVGVIRRPQSISSAIERSEPDVVLVDTTFLDNRGIVAFESALATDSAVKVLALTSDPPPHRDVARATGRSRRLR